MIVVAGDDERAFGLLVPSSAAIILGSLGSPADSIRWLIVVAGAVTFCAQLFLRLREVADISLAQPPGPIAIAAIFGASFFALNQ